MRTLALLCSTVALMAAAHRLGADEKLALPNSRQPHHALARMDKDGAIILQAKVISYRDEQREKAGGRIYIVRVPFEEIRESRSSSKGLQVFRADGKTVDPKDLPELLRKETHILVSAINGAKVDPFYLQIVKEDTLVLVFPDGMQKPR
jgi:hypothetical protein